MSDAVIGILHELQGLDATAGEAQPSRFFTSLSRESRLSSGVAPTPHLPQTCSGGWIREGV